MKELDVYIRGVVIHKSPYYRGRYECRFYGRQGAEIKQWLRDTFGEHDDMIYDSGHSNHDLIEEYESPITEEQLVIAALRWS